MQVVLRDRREECHSVILYIAVFFGYEYRAELTRVLVLVNRVD
jgi:hypothetical protein